MKNHIKFTLVFLTLVFIQNLKAQEFLNNTVEVSKIEYQPIVNYFEYNNVARNSYLNNVRIAPLTIVKSNMYSFSSTATEIVLVKPVAFINHENLVERKYYSLVETALFILADASVKLTSKSFK